MNDALESSNSGEERAPDTPRDNASSAPDVDGTRNRPLEAAAHDAASQMGGIAPKIDATSPEPLKASGNDGDAQKPAERRRRRRALISAPIRVRSADVTQDGPDEISTTLDVSRNGVLFASTLASFAAGMEVAVTFPYSDTPQIPLAEQPGRVVRVSELPDGRQSVAIALGVGVGEDLVDTAGRTLVSGEQNVSTAEPPDGDERPLVLAVDSDPAIRQSLKALLRPEGYDVIAVSCATEGHEVLEMFTPALLIAEIEGEELPGYELCAYCKSTSRLRTVPVVLLTSSAYPSDYANAHSLGAVVCMAKPYRQERLAHIVRLLAPTPQAKAQAAPARPADSSRRTPTGIKPPAANDSPQQRRRWGF